MVGNSSNHGYGLNNHILVNHTPQQVDDEGVSRMSSEVIASDAEDFLSCADATDMMLCNVNALHDPFSDLFPSLISV